jgi:hypothetical protein
MMSVVEDRRDGRCVASVLVVLRRERRVKVARAGTPTARTGREPNRRARAGARGSRRVALAAIATTVMLAWGAAASLAADYQDAHHNVCEGTFTTGGCASWGSHVTGFNNVAFGDSMMPALTSGSHNVASGFDALHSNTTGHNNLAFGSFALFSNTTGADNLASGTRR